MLQSLKNRAYQGLFWLLTLAFLALQPGLSPVVERALATEASEVACPCHDNTCCVAESGSAEGLPPVLPASLVRSVDHQDLFVPTLNGAALKPRVLGDDPCRVLPLPRIVSNQRIYQLHCSYLI